jgi:hypothetical protein
MPLNILENIYKDANENLSESVVSHAMTKDYVEAICRCNANKAPIRFLMSCLLAKIDNQNIDIRKPYKEIRNDDTYLFYSNLNNLSSGNQIIRDLSTQSSKLDNTVIAIA